MADLKSKRLIVIKGLLFISIVFISAIGIVIYCPRIEVIALLLILIWAAARSYYFLFYVLEKYVDPKLKYTGLIDLIKNMRK
ncbi:MAG: hypothetical protein JXA96_17645 [Sedimentisphaerales bacterium]|nr:hypothetical protein [Sedimentisphaerales bacterium]